MRKIEILGPDTDMDISVESMKLMITDHLNAFGVNPFALLVSPDFLMDALEVTEGGPLKVIEVPWMFSTWALVSPEGIVMSVGL